MAVIRGCYYAHGNVTGTNAGSFIGENNGGGNVLTSNCYWSDGAGVGIGRGTGEATEVTSDVTWAAAAEAMNAEIQDDGYQWVENPNETERESRPLITVKVTE